MLDLIFSGNLPNFNFRNRFPELVLVLGFGQRVFLNRLFVFENVNFFLYRSENSNWLVYLDCHIVFDWLSSITFFFYLLRISISFLNKLTFLHSLYQFLSWRFICCLFWVWLPHIFQILGENLLLLTIELVHQWKENS